MPGLPPRLRRVNDFLVDGLAANDEPVVKEKPTTQLEEDSCQQQQQR